MESDENQLGPPGAKRKRKTLFTVQEVLGKFEDFSELDCDNDEDYPEDDLDSISDDSDNPDLDEDLDLDRSSVRGRVPNQAGYVSIDLDLDVEEEGWDKVYQENVRTFDNTGCGPNNIPAETTELEHFVDLFLDNEFGAIIQCTLKIRKNCWGAQARGSGTCGGSGLKGLRATQEKYPK